MVYYCEASEDHKLTLHKGGKDGVIIATAETCLDHEGDTDIHFLPQINHKNPTKHPRSPLNPNNHPSNPSLERSSVIILSHVHHHFPSIHGKTSFTHNNKKFHWQGHAQLISDSNDELVARFEASWFEGKGHKIGVLDVMEMEMGMLDLVVFSGLIVQERTDEHKQAVFLLPQYSSPVNLFGLYLVSRFHLLLERVGMGRCLFLFGFRSLIFPLCFFWGGKLGMDADGRLSWRGRRRLRKAMYHFSANFFKSNVIQAYQIIYPVVQYDNIQVLP